MQITRHVPLDPALRAAGDRMDYNAQPRDETNAAFSEWMNTDRTDLTNATRWRYGSTILGTISVPIDIARALADEAPNTPAGNAWRDTVRECITLTEADVNRPFDEAAYDADDEKAADSDLDNLTEALRETSPLLEPVAETLTHQTLHFSDTLGDIYEKRQRITADGLTVGHKNECDKHDEDCYGDDRALALWAHIDVIAPGTETRVRDLIARMDADLPTMGSDDNGLARRPARFHD